MPDIFTPLILGALRSNFLVMFDEDLPKPKSDAAFPRNLELLSVSELEEYIKDLESEIKRVQDDIAKKKSSQDAAASVFK